MSRQKIPRIEIIFAAIGFLSLGIFLSSVQGREVHTDVLWYMNMSLNNIQDGMFQTRYTHVFLQKIFLVPFSNPFDGLKYYWAFLITTTSVLIYYNARTLFKRNNIIHAGIAVAFSFNSKICCYFSFPKTDVFSLVLYSLNKYLKYFVFLTYKNIK